MSKSLALRPKPPCKGKFACASESEVMMAARRVALHQHRRQGEQEFDNNKERRYDYNAYKMLRKIFEIQHHAHRDEKQAHEHVTVGQNAQ